MPATVTFCVHWSTGAPPSERVECDDVKPTETEDECKARVIRRAKTRADNGEAPAAGTTLWLERLVDPYGGIVASVTVSVEWEESWDAFVAACFA